MESFIKYFQLFLLSWCLAPLHRLLHQMPIDWIYPLFTSIPVT